MCRLLCTMIPECEVIMDLEDYSKAYKLGKKDYLARMHRGEKPTLQVLDDIMPRKNSYTEVPLGLVQIPIKQIVGTKTVGRSNSFAGNFMPILESSSEFASKWLKLSQSHLQEGIHTPVKAYEYMNQFYIEEGNKRVSVMKYFDAVSIPGEVTRIVPKRTNEKQNKIYYEFLDFYKNAPINYIWFSKEGSFAKLQETVGKKPDEAWTDDDLMKFSSVYTRFSAEYEAQGGNKLKITPGDAFLSFITLYGYDAIDEKTTNEMKELITKSWEEFQLLQEEQGIELKMKPAQEKKKLLNLKLLPLSSPKLKAAFIYERTPGTSDWTYAHELGRFHLEQTFSDELDTICFENGTQENADSLIEQAIDSGCNLILTTTPLFVQASVKAAIAHPQVRILNCSLNTSHRYIRTYYPRMHEVKFLMGALAGAMAENDKLAYIANQSDYISIANINAFALGAQMVNPQAQVYLEWTLKKELSDIQNQMQEIGASCISGKDMIAPEESSRFFGIYHIEWDGHPRNLAMPLWHWGKFYEQLIRTIMNGTWNDDKSDTKAINYWWGMEQGVVDLICSQYLPTATMRLIKLLKTTICSDMFHPFSGILYSQTGMVNNDPNKVLSPEEIVNMNWLAENVIGEIPQKEA